MAMNLERSAASDGRERRRRGVRPLASLAILTAAVTAAVVPFVLQGSAAVTPAHATGPGTTDFPLTSGTDNPLSIVKGPDGNLWFTELSGPNIGRVTPTGTITEYAVPTNGSNLQTAGIANGPGGNLWFTDWGNNAVGQITTSGAITEFTIPTANSGPWGIVKGPDGNLWITQEGIDDVAKVTPTGTVTEYPISSGAGAGFITVGSDGNMWFTETSLGMIGRITPGGVLTEFSLPSGSQPNGIVSGPDGNLWITEQGTNDVAQVSTSGTLLNQYAVTGCNARIAQITVGGDGNLWVSDSGRNMLDQVTTSGTITEFPTGHGIDTGGVTGITSGPHGSIWYTEGQGDAVGRFSLTASTALAVGAGVAYSTCNRPLYLTAGSDGNLWFTDGPNLDQITPSGTTTAFQPQPGYSQYLATGSDGALYMAINSSSVAKVDTSGHLLAEIPVGGSIQGLTPGPDGNMWFSGATSTGGFVGFMTTAAKYREFPLPAGDGSPGAITAGADGALWFATTNGDMARVTVGGAMTFFPVANADLTYYGYGRGNVTLGPDGNIWFLGYDNSAGHLFVGRMTATGTLKEFPVLSQMRDEVAGITTGADGKLWFNEPRLTVCPFGGGVARVTASGVITEYGAGCNDSSDQFNIVAGPDGNVWNGAYYGFTINKIGTGASSSCTAVQVSTNPSSVAQGATETLTTVIANCAATPQLMRLVTKTTPPSGCGTVTTAKTDVPLQPLVKTTVTSTFTAPSCPGTYTVKSTLTAGAQVVGQSTITYQVI